MKQTEVIEETYAEDDGFVETPEFKAWLDERVRRAAENPGRVYTYEELMKVAADELARLDKR